MKGHCALLILAIAICHAATKPVFQTHSSKADRHHVRKSGRSADAGLLEDDRETDYSIYSRVNGDFGRRVSSVKSNQAMYSKHVKDKAKDSQKDTKKRFHRKVKSIGLAKANRFKVKDDLIVADAVATPSQNFPVQLHIIKRTNEGSLSALHLEDISRQTILKYDTENEGYAEVAAGGHHEASASAADNTDSGNPDNNFGLRLNFTKIRDNQLPEVYTEVSVVTEVSEVTERTWVTNKDGKFGGDGMAANTAVREDARETERNEISVRDRVTEVTATTEAGATETGATEAGATEVDATEAGVTEVGTTELGTTEDGASKGGASEDGVTEDGATVVCATESGVIGATATEIDETKSIETKADETKEAVAIQVNGVFDDTVMTEESRIKNIYGVTKFKVDNGGEMGTGNNGSTEKAVTEAEEVTESGSNLAVTDGVELTRDTNLSYGIRVTESTKGVTEIGLPKMIDKIGKTTENYKVKERSARAKTTELSTVSESQVASVTESGETITGASADVDTSAEISGAFKSNTKFGLFEGKHVRDEKKVAREKTFRAKGKFSLGVQLPLKYVKYTKSNGYAVGAGVKVGRRVSSEGTGRSVSPEEEVASITYSDISAESISKLKKAVEHAEGPNEPNSNRSTRRNNGHTENKLSVEGNVKIEGEVTEGNKDQIYKGGFMLDKQSTTYDHSGINNNLGGGTFYDANNVRHYKDLSQFINAYNLGGNNAEMSYIVQKNNAGYLVDKDISDSMYSSGVSSQPSRDGYGDELYSEGTGYGVSAEGATSAYHGQGGSAHAGVNSLGKFDQSPLSHSNNEGIYYRKINDQAQYHFGYEVNDERSRDIKSHEEERNGDFTRGTYSLREPDGTIRTVVYHVDGLGGFQALVKKNGYTLHIPPQRKY